MRTKILALALAVSVLLLGCGPSKKGCQWWDRDCPDSPYGNAPVATSTTSTNDVEVCIEDCEDNLDCEDVCEPDPVP